MTTDHERPPAIAGGEQAGAPSALPVAETPAAVGLRPPSLEAVAKWSIAALLVLAIMALCFGLGFGLRMATEPSGAGSGSSTATRASGAPDFAVLNEIYNDLK